MEIGLQATWGALLIVAGCVAPAPAREAPPDVVRVDPAVAPPAASADNSDVAQAKAPVATGPRLTSVRAQTWIWRRPQIESDRFLGYIRVGQSVALRSPDKVRGDGCSRGFYAIAPRGYVCDDATVTLERDSSFLRANSHTQPRRGAHPYDFAISNGAPMYARLPTAEQQKKTEWRYGKAGEYAPLGMFQRGHEQLAVTDPIAPVDPVPEFLTSGATARGARHELLRRTIPHGSMLSYTRAFSHHGRTFLLSADLTLVPADRVRRFRQSRFRGVELGDVKLPIAWFRGQDRPQHAVVGDRLEPNGKSWRVRTFVELTGRERQQDRRTYLETQSGLYVDARDATVTKQRDKRPFGVAPDDKWLIVSISEGTLVAYQDLEPVYATLISPGQGGIPREGADLAKLVKDSTTPLGNYRITFKDRATTMSPDIGVADRTFWIADVPFTQYFRAPFALHATYWHESFGELMSGGCINASPIDAAWLFDWTEPHVPDGWQGATGAGAKANGNASWIVVTR